MFTPGPLTPCVCALYPLLAVAFRIYDIDGDGLVSSVELYRTLQQLVGNNFSDAQLEQVGVKPMVAAPGCMYRLSGYPHCGAEACKPLPTLELLGLGNPARFA